MLPHGHEEVDIAAAQLAWAMLQFSQSHLPPAVRQVASLGGAIGDVGARFYPQELTYATPEVPLGLLAFPKPIAITSMGARGLFATWNLSGAVNNESRSLIAMNAHSTTMLATAIESLSLVDDARVSLTVSGVTSLFPLTVLKRCVRDYSIFVGWLLHPPRGIPDTDARLLLIRADGICSTGESIQGTGR